MPSLTVLIKTRNVLQVLLPEEGEVALLGEVVLVVVLLEVVELLDRHKAVKVQGEV